MQEFKSDSHSLRRIGEVVCVTANCLLHGAYTLRVLWLQAAIGSDDAVDDNSGILDLLGL